MITKIFSRAVNDFESDYADIYRIRTIGLMRVIRLFGPNYWYCRFMVDLGYDYIFIDAYDENKFTAFREALNRVIKKVHHPIKYIKTYKEFVLSHKSHAPIDDYWYRKYLIYEIDKLYSFKCVSGTERKDLRRLAESENLEDIEMSAIIANQLIKRK